MYKLHKLPEGFIVTSYEDICSGDLFLVDGKIEQCLSSAEADDLCIGESFPRIIAQQDQIDFSSLSEEEQKEIDWFDVEKHWLEDTKTMSFGTTNKHDHLRNYSKGFQKAQELLSDRRFTLEDMRDVIKMSQKESWDEGGYLGLEYEEKEIIQSLSQPKSWEVDLEMETTIIRQNQCINKCASYPSDCLCEMTKKVTPKFTNSKIKITKII